MLRARYWATVIGFAIFLASGTAKAEIPLDNSIQTAPQPPPISPQLEKLEQPTKTYRPGETIAYRIFVRWPSQEIDDFRLSPPDLNLENLELLGVSQETVSKPEGADQNKGLVQVLTFRFTAQKPGKASANRFLLRWIQGGGTFTNELVIPELELTIAKPPLPWLRIGIIGGGALVIISIPLLLVSFLKKKKPLQEAPVLSPEDRSLEQLRESRAQWETNTKHQEFLSELTRFLQQYSSQKLDWNPSQDGYNALQKKAGEKWSKKDAQELTDLLQNIDSQRFSGASLQQEKLIELYQGIYSFIEKKKIV